MVIDLLLKEGRLKESGKTEGARALHRREVEGQKPSMNQLILALESPHNNCGQMMPAVRNMDEPSEVEYRQPIHQSSDQSNSGRKEIEKQHCRKEIECPGQGGITNQAFDSTLLRRKV